MNKREVPLWSGAIVGLAMVLALHASAHSQVQDATGLVGHTGQLNIGSEDNPPPTQAEPDWRMPGLGGAFCELIGYWGPLCVPPIKEVEPRDPEAGPITCDPNRPCGSEDTCCTQYSQ